MRRMVGAASRGGVCCSALQLPRLAGGVLRTGPAFQLSTLHGYGVPGLSLLQRVCEIPRIYGACCGAASVGWSAGARVVSGAAVDLHLIYLLESVALHGTEFRHLDAFRAKEWRCA